MTRPPEPEAGPDDSVAVAVLFLAVVALIVSFFISWISLYVAALCLSMIGTGLKIAAAIRHADRRPRL